MADALRASEQGIGKLLRGEAGIALKIFEPFGRVASGALKFEDFNLARLLVVNEPFGDRLVCACKHFGQHDRVLECELRPRTDREMCGMGRIAQQDELVVYPILAQHTWKIQPGGSAQMPRVRHQGLTIQPARKQRLASATGFILVHAGEAQVGPSFRRAFDNEGRGAVVEFVSVRPDPAMLGLCEDECERVEDPVRS